MQNEIANTPLMKPLRPPGRAQCFLRCTPQSADGINGAGTFRCKEGWAEAADENVKNGGEKKTARGASRAFLRMPAPVSAPGKGAPLGAARGTEQGRGHFFGAPGRGRAAFPVWRRRARGILVTAHGAAGRPRGKRGKRLCAQGFAWCLRCFWLYSAHWCAA